MKVNQQYYKYWKDIWSSQSEEVLDATLQELKTLVENLEAL